MWFQVLGPGVNFSLVRAPGELTTVIVTNLTAFTRYVVTVIAFTGPLEQAASEGKATGPIEFRTLEEGMCNLPCNCAHTSITIHFLRLSSLPEPKDPPKNVTISLIPEEVNSVKVTFMAPEEPNGNITAYFVYIYDKDQLVRNISLENIQRQNNTLTAVIDGLKGGQSYRIEVKPAQ